MSIHIIIKQGACPHISPNPFMHSMPPKDNMENQGQELPAHGHHILQPHNMATQAAALQQPKKSTCRARHLSPHQYWQASCLGRSGAQKHRFATAQFGTLISFF